MFVSALLTCIVLRAFSAQAKVVDDFDCKAFFYADTEPSGMDQNAKKICQWTGNIGPYYATLYSVYHRIPLYSAYRFDPACFTDSGRPSFWHLEPQVTTQLEMFNVLGMFSAASFILVPRINLIIYSKNIVIMFIDDIVRTLSSNMLIKLSMTIDVDFHCSDVKWWVG